MKPQLYQTGIPLQVGVKYTLTFQARSLGGGDLGVQVHRHSGPFTNYGLSIPKVDLARGWKTFTYSFTAAGFPHTTTDTRLKFWRFDRGETYEIDTVVMTADVPPPAPPRPCNSSPGNLLANPEFENGTAGWKLHTAGSAKFVTTPTAGGPHCTRAGYLQIHVASANTQLYQAPLELAPNARYRLGFAAKSTRGRDLSVAVHKHTAPYTSYGLAVARVDVSGAGAVWGPTPMSDGTGWTRHRYEFTTPSGVLKDARVRFSFGGHARNGDRYLIDDVVLERVR